MTPASIHLRRDLRSGFTLVEVLISIALVLVIVLGVNQVFSLTSQAVGTSNALSEITRDARNAQSIIFADLAAAEIDNAPFFVIRGTTISAFRNKEDQLRDKDYNTTSTDPDASIRSIDRNLNGVETDADDQTGRAMLTSRTHRADFLSFFVRSRATRQTGNPGTFSSTLAGNEQYVIYTHLRQLADPSIDQTEDFNRSMTPTPPNWRDPGPYNWPTLNYTNYTTTNNALNPTNNPYNFYASQWVLGRKAMILREPDTDRVLRDGSGTAYAYYGRGSHPTSIGTTTSRAPFSGNSLGVSTTGANTTDTVQNSYFDLAGITIARFNDYFPTILAANNVNTWVDPLVYRPMGFPAPSRPLTPNGVARTTPCFLPSCTQFAVEYAGDFVNQNAAGTVLNFAGNTTPVTAGTPPVIVPPTDGQVDFTVNPTTGARSVRWYGFPRDADNDGRILATGAVNQRGDVLPARDVVRSAFAGFGGFLFEKDFAGKFGVGIPPGTPPDNLPDYALPNALPRVTGSYPTSYLTAWGLETRSAGLPRPTMIRIVFALDDPLGRIEREQVFEFVAPLK